MIYLALILSLTFVTVVYSVLLARVQSRLDLVTAVATKASQRSTELQRLFGNLRFGLEVAQVQLTNHNNASGGFWTTGSGTVLRIRDMSNTHLFQARRWAKENNRPYDELSAEISRRRRNRRLAIWADENIL